MNRDSESKLTISSPLEANKANTLLTSLVALDNGYENPLFACLEVDYTEAEEEETGLEDATEKVLTYYEMDLWLNHIVRLWSEPVNNRSSLLVPVPGSGDGPGGVLVCAENFITWKHQGYKEVKIAIPRRKSPLENPERGLLIISHTTHKTKNEFFILLQSEFGDVYKLTFDWDKDKVNGLTIKYLDTVPLATSLCLFRRGYLFVPSEFGNQ